jgi:hypothetical protein
MLPLMGIAWDITNQQAIMWLGNYDCSSNIETSCHRIAFETASSDLHRQVHPILVYFGIIGRKCGFDYLDLFGHV